MSHLQQTNQFQKGDVLSVPVFDGLYNHKGVVVDNPFRGEPVVVSARLSEGSVVRERVSSFAGNASVSQIDNQGHEGPYSRARVARRAQNRVGEEYHLFLSNCEHFVREVSGLESKSPQIQQWAGTFLFLVLVAAVAQSS